LELEACALEGDEAEETEGRRGSHEWEGGMVEEDEGAGERRGWSSWEETSQI